jgi:hypothetical protein
VQSPLTLRPFAPQTGNTVRALTAHVERPHAGALRFRYDLDARLGRLRVPARHAARQVDELWKHTCFEAFIAPASGAPDASPATDALGEYRELNFSPSTEWAAYSFSGYRKGMTSIALQPPPDICAEAIAERLCVDVQVDLRSLFEHEPPSNLRVALAAVIEDAEGGITYWALKHAPIKPDFHHPAGFILEV